jgi:hypothetical protein
MRALILVLSLSILFPALALPAFADDTLVWKSSEPTCKTIIRQYGTERDIDGYATIHRMADGTLYRRNCDFLGNPDAVMSDIGMPEYPTKASMGGAKHVKILPNGWIRLY